MTPRSRKAAPHAVAAPEGASSQGIPADPTQTVQLQRIVPPIEAFYYDGDNIVPVGEWLRGLGQAFSVHVSTDPSAHAQLTTPAGEVIPVGSYVLPSLEWLSPDDLVAQGYTVL